jgi:OmpA-like transmembrane domain
VCALTLPVQAAELGFYVGGIYGTASKEADNARFDEVGQAWYDFFGYTAATTTSTLDDEDSAFGFFAGYRLLPYLAFEGGYIDMGNVEYRAKNTGAFGTQPSNLNLNLDSKSSGITLSALGILPLSYRFEVFARGGIVFATNTVHTFAYNEVASETHEGSETATNLLAGAGASFTFLEIYGARLEYQRIFDAGEDLTGKSDVDMLTLAITVRF